MANTADRWQALRDLSAAAGPPHIVIVHRAELSNLIAAHDALALECNALREALRANAVFITEQMADGHYYRECDVCNQRWDANDPEAHAAGCLAQLKE